MEAGKDWKVPWMHITVVGKQSKATRTSGVGVASGRQYFLGETVLQIRFEKDNIRVSQKNGRAFQNTNNNT